MEKVPFDPSSKKGHLLLFSLSIFSLFTLSRAVSSEIFLDGVTYAAISRNLASDIGTFWNLHYTKTISPFHDHPPLALWLQSLAFRLLGDTTWIDFLWGVAMGGVMILLLVLLWGKLGRLLPCRLDAKGEDSPGPWWPVLLFILPPLVPWCMANNLLENTLTVFVLLTALLALHAVSAPLITDAVLFSFVGGITLFFGALSKGLPAFFVLAIPFWGWLLLKPIKLSRFLLVTAVMALTCGLLMLIVYQGGGQGVRAFLHTYLHSQILGSLAGEREVAPSPYFLALKLIQQIAWPLTLNLLLTLLVRRGRARAQLARARGGMFFFLLAVALSGSAPIFLMPKQMEWYLLPSMPFYALALAQLFQRNARKVEGFIASLRRKRALTALSMVIMLGTATAVAFFHGSVQVSATVAVRDLVKEKLSGRPINDGFSEYCWRHFSRDILSQEMHLPAGQMVSACPKGFRWRLLAYLQRHHRVSLTPQPGHRYLLVERGKSLCRVPKGCVLIQKKQPARFSLYRCKDSYNQSSSQ